jgi:hypothetical protein
MRFFLFLITIGLSVQLFADPIDELASLEEGVKLIVKQDIRIPANSHLALFQFGKIVSYVKGCNTYCALIMSESSSRTRILKVGTELVVGRETNKYFETPKFTSPSQVKKISCIAEVKACSERGDLAGLLEIGKNLGTLGAFERDTAGILEIIYPEPLIISELTK